MLRCPNCMNEMAQNGCNHCGYPDVKQVKVSGALVPGTVVGSRFELGLVKQDSFQSVAYIAWDMHLQRPAVVTEFFPRNQATRKNGLVAPRRFAALFQQACTLYVQSQQPMPLTLIAAFAENGTAYRAYLLEEAAGQASEVIDRLLDLPIYFRDSSQNPLMNVCALEIPPMPVRREWRQPEHEVIAAKPKQPEHIEAPVQPVAQPESQVTASAARRNHRGLKIAAVAIGAAILATVGATAFFITQKHDVTIEIKTNAGIASAKIGAQQLPAATPDEHGTVAYTVQLANGTYTFEAEGTNGMCVPSEEIQVLSGNVTRQLVLPDPTATPIPRIAPEEGEWVYADENGACTIVSANHHGEVNGELDCAMYAYTVTIENGNADDMPFAVGNAGGVVEVQFTNGALAFQSSETSCTLYLSIDGAWKSVAGLQGGTNRQNKIDGEAIGMLKTLGENGEIIFVGEESSLSAQELTLEKLGKWVVDYPELYGKYTPKELFLSLDERMSDASVTIDGKVWTPGTRVCLVGAEQVDLSVAVGDDTFSETVSAEKATGEDKWIIGQGKCDEIAAKWADTLIVLQGNSVVLPQNQPALQADMKNYPGVFEQLLQTVTIDIDSYFLQMPIDKVMIGDYCIAENNTEKKWSVEIETTTVSRDEAALELTIRFENGHEEKKTINVTEEYIIINLKEKFDEYDRLFDDMEGAVTLNDESICLLKDGATVDELPEGYTAEQVIRMFPIFKSADQRYDQYDIAITTGGKIRPESVSITICGRPAEEIAKLSAGEYQVEITVDGQVYTETITVSAEAENSYTPACLARLAEEAIGKLPQWGAKPAYEDFPLLTEKVIDDEWKKVTNNKAYAHITLKLPEEENVVKWLLTDENDNELQLAPNEQNIIDLYLPPTGRYVLLAQMENGSTKEAACYVKHTFSREWNPKLVDSESLNSTPTPTLTPTPTPTPTQKLTPKATPKPTTTLTPTPTPTLTTPTPTSTSTSIPTSTSTSIPTPTSKPSVATKTDITGSEATAPRTRGKTETNVRTHIGFQTSTTSTQVRNGDE